jgi:hypothetical protein
MDAKPFASGSFNQVHRGAKRLGRMPVIIRRTKKEQAKDTEDPQERLHMFVEETLLMQIASDAQFGPALYSAGVCENAPDPHFWQAMEPFTGNLNDYVNKFAPCGVKRLGDIESSLRELFLKMAKARMFCMDLKPANVVVQFDQDGVIEKMRLIDFDNTFCLTRVEDKSVSVNTLMLSMLIVFSSNTYKVCRKMFFRTFLNNVFSGAVELPIADGKVLFSSVVSFLTHANTSAFTVPDLMRHYYTTFAANERIALRRMVHDVLSDEETHQAPAAPGTEVTGVKQAGKALASAGKAGSSAGKARSSAGKARSSAGSARSSAGSARSSAGTARPSAGKAHDSAGKARPSAGGR